MLSVFVFLLAGFVMFGKISDVLRKKTGGYSDMIHSFYELDENTVDVLCLGSSHGYSSFQPNVLWNEHGITSYVMCSPRQTMASSYYLLQEALTKQTPSVLLLETYYIFEKEKYKDDASLRYAFDGIRLGEVKHEMISDLLSEKSWKEKLSYYIPFLKYHGRWDQLENSDFNSRTYLKGSILGFEVYPMGAPELPDKAIELSEHAALYLEKIIELCEEQNIELILYTAPYGYKNKEEEHFDRKQRFNLTMKTYCEEKEIPYFDFQRITDSGIDFAEDFRDYSHMNTYGATKITQYLGAYLTETKEMPDHRADERFVSWQQDYERYENAVRAKIGDSGLMEE